MHDKFDTPVIVLVSLRTLRQLKVSYVCIDCFIIIVVLNTT